MASYHEASRTGKFTGVYVCSHCKSVIMSDFVFRAVGYSRWTQKKAKEAADEAAELGLTALKSFVQKPFLVTAPTEDRSYSLVSGFALDGLEKGCPYCGSRERWQLDPETANGLPRDPETGVALVTDVPKTSRMLLATEESVEEMGRAVVQMITEQNKAYWEAHTGEATAVRKQIQSIKDQIGVLTAQKEVARDNSHNLYQQKKQKEEQMKGLSLFSGERKTLKAELKELEKRYETQRAADMAQETSLFRSIQEYQNQLKSVLVKNPGVLGEYEQITVKNDPSILAIRYN